MIVKVCYYVPDSNVPLTITPVNTTTASNIAGLANVTVTQIEVYGAASLATTPPVTLPKE